MPLQGGSFVPRAFGWCIGCGELATLDFLWNVALFIPLGASLTLAGRMLRRLLLVFLIALLLSAAIELSQLWLIRGRDAALADIVANSLGGSLGAWLTIALSTGRPTSPRVWRRCAWGAALLGIGALIFGAWATKLAVARTSYYVQWQPQRPGYAPFAGELSALTVNDLTLAPGEIVPPERLPAPFFAGHITLDAQLVHDTLTSQKALIARLAADSREFLMLGQKGTALITRYRANAQRVRLRSPIFRLPDAFAANRAGTARLTVRLNPGELVMQSHAAARETRVYVNTARAWAVMLPFEVAVGPLGLLADLLWLALLAMPVAYCSVRAKAGWRAATPVVAVGATLAALSIAQDPSLWWWPYWLAVAAATLMGTLLGRRARMRSEYAPPDRARTLEQHVFPVRSGEEA